MKTERISWDAASGMLLGLAIGDALGASLEFHSSREPENYLREYKSGGPHNLPAGYWTDDTSMALAIAEGILERNGEFDPHLIMENFVSWMTDGEFSSTGTCFDIGMTCQMALGTYRKDKSNPYCGPTDPYSAGNGALMRMAPVIIAARDEREAIENALLQTRLTHGCTECLQYSEAFARELWIGKALDEYRHLKLPTDTHRKEVKSGGYVKETYQCAWWAVENTYSFEEAVVTAVNRGHDADTAGAVTGQLAGRIYGCYSFPDWMFDGLYEHDQIRYLASKLHDLNK